MEEGNKIRNDGGLSQLDRYLRALNDRHRRQVLYYLDDHGTANVEELARHIAAPESNHSSSGVPEEEWTPIQTQLYHQHLPRLEEYGIVDYDGRSKDVSLADLPHLFEMLLHFCRLVETPPS